MDRYTSQLTASLTDNAVQLSALYNTIAFNVVCAPTYFVDKLLSFGLHAPQVG